LADAQPGETVRQCADHYDLWRGTLFKIATVPNETTRRTWKGRSLAIDTALDNFDRAAPDHLPMSRAGYKWLLMQAFALLDRLPLSRA
jgi:hypothetical protein